MARALFQVVETPSVCGQAPMPGQMSFAKKLTRNMSHNQWKEWVSPLSLKKHRHPGACRDPEGGTVRVP
jgi:hypothetical protein